MFISSACKPVAPGDEVVVVSAKILRSQLRKIMDLYLSSQVALASFSWSVERFAAFSNL